MPSIRLSALVVLMVILAGCGGGTGTTPDDGTPTVTPTGTHEDPPATASPPAGTSEDGIENASVLIDAHVEQLQGVDHRVEASRLANRSDALRQPLNATVHYGEDVTYFEQRANATKDGIVPHESFLKGSTLFRKNQDPNGSEEYYYRHDPRPDAIFHLGWSEPLPMLQQMLTLGNFEYVDRETVDGTTMLRFEADGATDENVREFEGTALVSLDGVVHVAEGSYVVDTDHDQPYEVEFSYELDRDVGPPEEPSWVESVPQPVVERTANGTVLALENRGETAIEAGTEFGVILSEPDDPISGDVTLPDRLGPGETVYVYAIRTEDGAEVRIATERPAETGDLVDLRDRTAEIGHDSDRIRFQAVIPPENATAGSD